MHKYGYRWLMGCMAILLLASGCFQAAGTGPDSLSVAENTNPTWTPSPFPTSEPVIVTQPVVVTATENPFAEQPTPNPFDNQSAAVGQVPEIATQDIFGAQAIDPIYVTATYIVQRATETQAYFMTLTAGIPFATETPTLNPFEPTATPTFNTGNGCSYTVVVGDNLFRIALRYNVTLDQLVQANGITNPNLIVVGNVLQIPGCGSTTPPVDNTGGTGTAGSGTTYTVKQGDTLFTISLQFGVPVTSIAAANNITDINLIHINDQLVIPPA